MRIIALLLLMTHLLFAYPKMYHELADEVYPFMKSCQKLQSISSLKASCERFLNQAQGTLKLGRAIEAKQSHDLKAYVKTLRQLEQAKKSIIKESYALMKKALKAADAKRVSLLIETPNIPYLSHFYKSIDKAHLKLSPTATRLLNSYKKKRHLHKLKARQQALRAAEKKQKSRFWQMMCGALDYDRSFKHIDTAMINTHVVGISKAGYILEEGPKRRYLLNRLKLPYHYKIGAWVSIKVQSRAYTTSVDYAYHKHLANIVKKHESLPVILYQSEVPKACYGK